MCFIIVGKIVDLVNINGKLRLLLASLALGHKFLNVFGFVVLTNAKIGFNPKLNK